MRSNPLSDLEELFDRVSRQVEDGMLEGTGFPVPGTIAVDVAEYDDHYLVTADLPGYDLEAIEVTLQERTLELEADREEEVLEREDEDTAVGHEDDKTVERYLRRERRHQTVRRRLTLPGPVEADAVTASYDNGVLTVTLPMQEQAEESMQIDID